MTIYLQMRLLNDEVRYIEKYKRLLQIFSFIYAIKFPLQTFCLGLHEKVTPNFFVHIRMVLYHVYPKAFKKKLRDIEEAVLVKNTSWPGKICYLIKYAVFIILWWIHTTLAVVKGRKIFEELTVLPCSSHFRFSTSRWFFLPKIGFFPIRLFPIEIFRIALFRHRLISKRPLSYICRIFTSSGA